MPPVEAVQLWGGERQQARCGERAAADQSSGDRRTVAHRSGGQSGVPEHVGNRRPVARQRCHFDGGEPGAFQKASEAVVREAVVVVRILVQLAHERGGDQDAAARTKHSVKRCEHSRRFGHVLEHFR